MRGFVTLAVGSKRYYKLALNLLKSYRHNSANPVPFAIIADRENYYTKQFDKVIILEKPTFSYMDKIQMLKTPPFDNNIFVDADCLAYGDLNEYWKYCGIFEGVSCFGKALPVTSQEGWFEITDVGEHCDDLEFIPQMHGGIIFFHNDKVTRRIYKQSCKIAENYLQYRFKYFDKPADEPILALSMAINKIRPIELPEQDAGRMFLFYPTAKKIVTNIREKKLCYMNKKDNWIENVLLLHWQNLNTKKPQYKIEIVRLNERIPDLLIMLWKPVCFFYSYLENIFEKIVNRLAQKVKKGRKD